MRKSSLNISSNILFCIQGLQWHEDESIMMQFLFWGETPISYYVVKKKRHCYPQTFYTYAYTEKEIIFIRGRLILLAGLCLHTVEMKTDYLAQVWLIRSHAAQSQCLWAVWPQRRLYFTVKLNAPALHKHPHYTPFTQEDLRQNVLLNFCWNGGGREGCIT